MKPKQNKPVAKIELPVAEKPEDLFRIDDRLEETIPMPEWGCSVVVREPDAAESALIAESCTDKKGNFNRKEFNFKYVFSSIVKPAGLTQEHFELLKKRSGSAFNRLLLLIGKKKEPSSN